MGKTHPRREIIVNSKCSICRRISTQRTRKTYSVHMLMKFGAENIRSSKTDRKRKFPIGIIF